MPAWRLDTGCRACFRPGLRRWQPGPRCPGALPRQQARAGASVYRPRAATPHVCCPHADDLPALHAAGAQMMLITIETCSAFTPHYQSNCGEVLYVKSGEGRRAAPAQPMHGGGKPAAAAACRCWEAATSTRFLCRLQLQRMLCGHLEDPARPTFPHLLPRQPPLPLLGAAQRMQHSSHLAADARTHAATSVELGTPVACMLRCRRPTGRCAAGGGGAAAAHDARR